MALRRGCVAAALVLALAGKAAAQEAPFAAPSGRFVPDQGPSNAPVAKPGVDKPGVDKPQATPAGEPESDTWIFSGLLQESAEAFSGTLITGKSDVQFELKLAGGVTCDGGDLHPSLGLVRLSEIRCSDDRMMRALFVPQGRETLKVFGHVGEARFATVAHLLGTQPPPEPKQTAAPHAPPARAPDERLPGAPGRPKPRTPHSG